MTTIEEILSKIAKATDDKDIRFLSHRGCDLFFNVRLLTYSCTYEDAWHKAHSISKGFYAVNTDMDVEYQLECHIITYYKASKIVSYEIHNVT